ncbi:TIR domain-containing protein [Embleya sp. NPDC127516]|uniref:TIR domain-containing protein n=1 Tax=Embleya sp. NPDC127516 TaxID=3363990 RepID=UPI00382B35E5
MNEEENPAGFWSYTHRDDVLDDGRILRLAESISHEFEIVTGEALNIFRDNTSLAWGHVWLSRIDSALATSTFFIPVITPRYFKSQQCRREIISFAQNAASLGLEELLLPIYYVNVPELSGEHVDDEVVTLIRERQRVDWRELRLADEKSPEYRQAINKLAIRLSEILEQTAAAVAPNSTPPPEEPDEPGTLEIMAATEEALPRWLNTINLFAEVTSELLVEMQWAAGAFSDSDAHGKGFAGRLKISRELAERLDEPVEKITSLGSQYSAELLAIDPGMIGIIRQATEGQLSAEETKMADDFFSGIKDLVEVTRTVTPSLKEFASGASNAAKVSRHIRPVMNQIQAAIQKVIDGQTIIEGWARLIDEVDE